MEPDYEIEQYWYGLKQSMINFYNKSTNKRPIELWSNELNLLQKNKEYEKIENNIRNYKSLYAIDLMKSFNSYHCGILKTNMKRWNGISNKYNLYELNTIHRTIFTLFDIMYYFFKRKTIDDELMNIYEQIELYILYQDYTVLIKYAVKNNRPNILEKLNEIINVRDIISKQYNLNIDNMICFNKLCLQLYSK